MYTNTRNSLSNTVSSLKKMHTAIGRAGGDDECLAFLNACQKAAITVGNVLESEAEKKPDILSEPVKDAVLGLEEYCELLYEITQNGVTKEAVESLNVAVDKLKAEIDELPVIYKVVFFPYKVEMWDSLESIYLVAREDARCEAYCVPIPYFEKDLKTDEWKVSFDGDKYPDYVKTVPYDQYDVSVDRPDVAYVHNPYDEFNHVTSIPEEYYSYNLKNNVGKLIYVPYYVTDGHLSEDHAMLSVYRNMDHAVVQSELMKSGFKGLPWHGKVLAFGSPKFDKVIKKNREGVSIPEEWKEKLEGKKTLMLNTSINDLLGNGERVLKKLDSFFTMIKDYGNIAVIWRPHPVLKATMKAMRPQFLEEYERLEKRFEDEGVGVLDRTPVIEDTIAISDGYIGSGGSSVINLFSILGKPVFIFDPGLEEITPKERRLLKWVNGFKVRDRVYLAAQDINGIFSFKLEAPEEGLRYEGMPFDKPLWRKQMGALWGLKDKLYLGPVFGEDAVSYDPVMKRFEKLQSGGIGEKYNVKFAGIGFAGDSIFLFPDTKYIIMEYVTAKDGWLYHTTDVDELMEGISWEPGIPLCCGIASYKNELYVSNGIDNKVLKIYAGTGKYEVFELEPDGKVHNLIEDENQQIIEERARRIRNNKNCSRIVIKGAYEKGLIYMVGGSAEYRVRPWNGGKEFVITIPEDNYKYIRQGDFGQPLPAINDILGLYDHLITIDSNGSHLLKISNETNELSYIAEDFWKGADEPCRNFDPMYNAVGRYLAIIDSTHILVQRERDSKMAIIDVENDTCKEFDLELPEDLFNELVPRDAGFDKGDDRDYFCMYESRVFSLENFLEVFAEDGYASVKERQMEAVKDIAANLDGTCGEKVHEYIMNELLSAEKMQHT